MQTFLIISRSKDKEKIYIEEYLNKNNIDSIDCTFLSFEGSFGIENVRNLQKALILKPIKGTKKALVVENFQTATIQAQNAMLKILEEPPQNTIIFLTSSSTDFILPTVLSRCFVLTLDDNDTNYLKEEITEFEENFINFQKLNQIDKLKLAQDLSFEKENALSWIKKAIILSREKMLENLDFEYVSHIKTLQKVYNLATTTNVNLRFLLEIAFLNEQV